MERREEEGKVKGEGGGKEWRMRVIGIIVVDGWEASYIIQEYSCHIPTVVDGWERGWGG